MTTTAVTGSGKRSEPRISELLYLRARVMHALMVASRDLRICTYWYPVRVGDEEQLADLRALYRKTFNRKLPADLGEPGLRYLISVRIGADEPTPVLLAEEDVLPYLSALAFALGGEDMADQISYRRGMYA